MAQPTMYEVKDDESVYAESSVGDSDGRATVVGDRKAHDRYVEILEAVVEDQHEWFSGDDDDDSGSSVGEKGKVDALAVSVAMADLRDLATRLQRSRRAGMLNVFSRGRPARVAAVRGGPVRYKQYSVTGSMIVNELESANGLYEQLATGARVATTIVARTGLGKTTKLPSMIVKNTSKRVLLLEPDVKLSRYAADAANKLVNVRKVWSVGMTDYLLSMSYGDFYGHFIGENGRRLLECFDVVIMDESTADNVYINVCRTLLATYGPPTLSVLECSATADGRDAQSSGALVEPIYADVTLNEFVGNGYLWRGAYAKDRTMVIANGDRQAAEIYKKIYDAGFECMLLDSASRYSDVNKVRDFFSQPAAVTNRFVVVVPSYGYGYNIPVNHVITSAEEIISEVIPGESRVVEKVIRLTEAQIKQHGGRAGREGSAGVTFVVCSSASNVEKKETLSFSQRVKIYLMLIACNINVPASMYTDVRELLLPYGITKQLALDVLALNMPPEVALRFFGRDGRVPYKYAQALEAFAIQDYRYHYSEFDAPADDGLWVSETIGGYYESGEPSTGIVVKVPVSATGDLQVVLHAIAASAAELLEIENTRMSSSDTELDDVVKSHRRIASVTGVYRPRAIEDVVAVVPPTPVRGFIYDVPQEQQRGGRLMISTSVADALSSFTTRDLDPNITDFSVNCPVVTEHDRSVERVGILSGTLPVVVAGNADEDIPVHSPGGNVVVSFRKSVWDKMVVGEALVGNDVRSFMNAVKHNIDGFVHSDALSGWTDVWLSIFATMSHEDNILLVKRSNLTDRLIALLLALVTRYVSAVKAVSRSSCVHASVLYVMLNGGSLTKALSKQSKKGKLEVVQSRQFFERLFELRDAMVHAISSLEREGVFAPSVVISLQQLLPIMRKTGNRVIDAPTSDPSFSFRTGFLGGRSGWK